ncbi:MAG TPA: DUF4235 domain-containing protein [Bacteroidales bacterium]|nr:DUF4235 domain-containing protein [Bacteroidales bacterium]
MKAKNKEILKEALATGAIMLSGFMVQKAIDCTYKSIRGKEVPKNANESGVSWGKAFLWTLATGAVISIVKTAVRPYVDVGVDEMLDV